MPEAYQTNPGGLEMSGPSDASWVQPESLSSPFRGRGKAMAIPINKWPWLKASSKDPRHKTRPSNKHGQTHGKTKSGSDPNGWTQTGRTSNSINFLDEQKRRKWISTHAQPQVAVARSRLALEQKLRAAEASRKRASAQIKEIQGALTSVQADRQNNGFIWDDEVAAHWAEAGAEAVNMKRTQKLQATTRSSTFGWTQSTEKTSRSKAPSEYSSHQVPTLAWAQRPHSSQRPRISQSGMMRPSTRVPGAQQTKGEISDDGAFCCDKNCCSAACRRQL